MAQKDLKKLVAYSSVSHMGYVMLGMASFTPQGINGAVLQMFNHGTVTAMLFLLVGVIYDRAHHREIDGFGGLATDHAGVHRRDRARVLRRARAAGPVGVHLRGAGAARRVADDPGADGHRGQRPSILTAGYLLWTMQRMYLGPVNEKYVGLPEINGRELFTLVPLGAIVVVLGVYPHADPRPDRRIRCSNLNHMVLPVPVAGVGTGTADRSGEVLPMNLDSDPAASAYLLPELILGGDRR